YQQLDNLSSKEELMQFHQELEDRFGPIPKQVKELFKSFEMRWLAETLAMEKIIIKSSKMICSFVDNPESKFYDTAQFQYILQYVLSQPDKCKVTDKDGKFKIVFSDVKSMNQAIGLLEEMVLV